MSEGGADWLSALVPEERVRYPRGPRSYRYDPTPALGPGDVFREDVAVGEGGDRTITGARVLRADGRVEEVRVVDGVAREQHARLEELAAAYLQRTGLAPQDAVLCARARPDGTMQHWYETKQEADARPPEAPRRLLVELAHLRAKIAEERAAADRLRLRHELDEDVLQFYADGANWCYRPVPDATDTWVIPAILDAGQRARAHMGRDWVSEPPRPWEAEARARATAPMSAGRPGADPVC